MNNVKLDVVVPLTIVDLPTFLDNIFYLKSNLPCKRIVVIGNEQVGNKLSGIKEVVFLNEDTLYPSLSFDNVKSIKRKISGSDKRTGWYFQQFLKMAYSYFCQDSYYLIWDSDTIPINKIDFFDKDGKAYLDYRQYEKRDECYNPTQDALICDNFLKKKVHKSFIAEHMLINVEIMKCLITDLTTKGTAFKSSFYENILYSIPLKQINLSGFSEFECYAAYVLKKYPNSYTLRFWRNLRNAKTYVGNKKTQRNLQWFSHKFDVVSFEDYDSQWVICKLICCIDKSHAIPFFYIYNIINPIYQLYYKIRLKVRYLLMK